MRSSIMAPFIVISFLIIVGRSNARLLVDPDTLSSSGRNTGTLFDDDSGLHTANGPMEKDVVDYVEEMRSSSSANSATNEKTLSLRPSVPKNYEGESATSKKAMNVNFMATDQQLSTSSNSPGIGHMQMIPPSSQTRNVDKSHQSNGDEHLQPEKSNKRKLGSTPSPGDGH